MRRTHAARALALLMLSATLALSGCGMAGRQGAASGEELTRQVSDEFGDDNEATLDIPRGWDAEVAGEVVSITPEGFDGIIELGATLSGVSEVTSDEQMLDRWEHSGMGITGDWEKVSSDDDPTPVYESPAKLEGDKQAQGIVRVVITGDDSVAVVAFAAGADWEDARPQIEKVVGTLKVSDPQAPHYSEPEPKDAFTIVGAKRTKTLGQDFWELGVTVRNNTDEPKQFLGFRMDELDAEGNIIDSYMSYQKNSMPTVVEPGQTLTIPLTMANEDGVAGMQSRYCEWGEDRSSAVKSEYSETFRTMF